MSCPSYDHLLILPRLRVHNANAVSSPLTHGFPSITAFLGLAWALERKARAAGLALSFPAVGAIAHGHQEQTTEGGFVKAFRLTRNPIGSDGKTAAIVEEGRIHLELSLVLAVRSERWTRQPETRDGDSAVVAELLAASRIAGGTVLPSPRARHSRYRPRIVDLSGTPEDRQAQFRNASLRLLLPGFALVSHDDQLQQRLEEMQVDDPAATPLQAWLSLSRINWAYRPGAKGQWQHDRGGNGWIVPIPVGYGALGDIHPPGSVANARDTATPFRFVESLYSIGQWVSPHRLHSPEQLLWYADSQPEAGLYRARNDYRAEPDPLEELYDFD